MSNDSASPRHRLSRRMKRGVARVRRRLTDLDTEGLLSTDALRDRLAPSDLDADTLRDRLDRIDVAFLEDGAEHTTDADVQRVVDEADAIEARFQNRGPLARLLDDGRLLLDLVRDTARGDYRRVPAWTLTAAAFALLYVLNPLDLIPDALPVIGALDDAAVVSLCLVLLEQDLEEYRVWQLEEGTEEE